MRDRQGMDITVGDEVIIHLPIGDRRGTVYRIGDYVYCVSSELGWVSPGGGMCPENVTVNEMDIGL